MGLLIKNKTKQVTSTSPIHQLIKKGMISQVVFKKTRKTKTASSIPGHFGNEGFCLQAIQLVR